MGGWVAVPTLLTADPPAQTRYRKVIAKAFHPNAVNKFEPAVREITSRPIDSWIETGRIEFVSQFGVPTPGRGYRPGVERARRASRRFQAVER